MGGTRLGITGLLAIVVVSLAGCTYDSHSAQSKADSFHYSMYDYSLVTAHHSHIEQAIIDGRYGKAKKGLERTRKKLNWLYAGDDSMEMVIDLKEDLVRQRRALLAMLAAPARNDRNADFVSATDEFDRLQDEADETVQNGTYNTFGGGNYGPDEVEEDIDRYYRIFKERYQAGEPWPLTYNERMQKRWEARKAKQN